jgi:hypothetical protein
MRTASFLDNRRGCSRGRLRSGAKKLGMSEYAQRFVDNRIDLSVLHDLTDQDDP